MAFRWAMERRDQCLLARLMPDETEARALLALCLATDARRAARYDSAGSYVTLEEQDRSLYDAAAIAALRAKHSRPLRP